MEQLYGYVSEEAKEAIARFEDLTGDRKGCPYEADAEGAL